MSYLAIARKYRPATFDQIVGQEHVTRTLKNAILRGRIHHAYLFGGARGVGKTTAARALARALNCREGPTPTPCGVCPSCLEVAQGNSPDLIEIDGASNNSVDDIRELREGVRFAPTRGKFRIYLIDEVHMLSKGAFNALLKTLEEPPPHVVFIFATTEVVKIPETILSRVQRFDFKRIPVPGVSDRLRAIATAEGYALSEAGLRLIARAGEGSMRDAQSLLDQVISYAAPPATTGALAPIADESVAEALGLIDREWLYDMLTGLVTGDPDKCFGVIDKVYSYGFELAEFTEEMLEILRNATFVRLAPAVRRYVEAGPEEIGRLEEITRDVPAESLTRAFTALLEVHDQVSRAPRPRLVLEMAVARLATTRPVQPVGALLGRLEEVERRLRAGGHTAPIGGLRNARAPRANKARAEPPDDDSGPGRPVMVVTPSPAPPAAVDAPPRPSAGPSLAPEPASNRPPEPAAAPEAPPDAPWDDGVWAPLPAARTAPPKAPAAPPAPALPPDQRRFAAFATELRALGPGPARIADGEAVFADGRLRVAIPQGRALAEARRAADQVAQALARHYPERTVLEIVPRSPDGRPTPEDLVAEVERDPAVRRITERLGAVLGRVTGLAEPKREEK